MNQTVHPSPSHKYRSSVATDITQSPAWRAHKRATRERTPMLSDGLADRAAPGQLSPHIIAMHGAFKPAPTRAPRKPLTLTQRLLRFFWRF